jgi:hypothetical protein
MSAIKGQTVRPMTPGQMKELIATVTEGIPSSLSFDVAQRLIGKKRNITKKVKEFFLANDVNNHSELIVEWQALYKKLFGKEYDLSNVIVPERPSEGRWRLLIIADLTLEQLYAKCKERFKCWRWMNDDLDKKVTWNERDAKNGAYAIWVKDEVEADEELKNLSANNIKAKSIITETLAERLIYELKFFDETGSHLDINSWTLCTGSRYDDGNVPYVFWNSGDELCVDWCYPDDARGVLRSRQVVS